MKGLILKLVTWVIAVFMIIGMGSVATEAFEYLGEFCWHATEEGDPDSFILKLGVFHMGGNHYYLSGYEYWLHAPDKIGMVNGHALAINGIIKMTFINPGNDDVDGEAWFGGSSADLNPVTLSGTWRGVDAWVEYGVDSGVSTQGGTLTFITCP